MKNRRRRRRFAKGKRAVGICERSGFKHLLRDLVEEPGTGLLVYKNWSDGKWNRVDHPLNFPADTAEAIGLRRSSSDVPNTGIGHLMSDDGILILTDDGGQPIFV